MSYANGMQPLHISNMTAIANRYKIINRYAVENLELSLRILVTRIELKIKEEVEKIMQWKLTNTE